MRNKAAHLVVGVDTDGIKHVLGIWLQNAEGAKFWPAVLTELRNRGVRDVLIACCDGLEGLPQAVETVWPHTIVQTCVVHLIRASMRYVSYTDRKKLAAALKPFYTAANADAAQKALLELAETELGRKHKAALAVWERAWDRFIPFLEFPPEIRKIIYTTNAIENLNFQIRKIIKNRGHFPTDDSVIKLAAPGQRRIEHRRRPHHCPGPRPAADPDTYRYGSPILVRSDSAGSSYEFLAHIRGLREHGIHTEFSVGVAITKPVRAAIATAEDWVAALDGDGGLRDGAELVELTNYLDPGVLASFPAGTRLICRRERPHPGAQLTLFDTINGMRHQVFATDTPHGAGSIQFLEVRHRCHARVEDRIRTGKTTGFGRFPSRSFAINTAWLELALTGIDLHAGTDPSSSNDRNDQPPLNERRRLDAQACLQPSRKPAVRFGLRQGTVLEGSCLLRRALSLPQPRRSQAGFHGPSDAFADTEAGLGLLGSFGGSTGAVAAAHFL